MQEVSSNRLLEYNNAPEKKMDQKKNIYLGHPTGIIQNHNKGTFLKLHDYFALFFLHPHTRRPAANDKINNNTQF